VNHRALFDQLQTTPEPEMKSPMHVLFLCSMNRLRSPTAEQVFASHPGVETRSAGLLEGAEEPVTPELLRWAHVVFVMEQRHREKLKRWRMHMNGQRVVCLGVPDDYAFMQPELVDLLKQKVTPFLPG
jgi:predicted protein tyrosine phosphatase